MMRYIQPESSYPNQNETSVTTTATTISSSPDIPPPRPTTLSSFLSSFSYQSYGSIGSGYTSLLNFRNNSGILNNTGIGRSMYGAVWNTNGSDIDKLLLQQLEYDRYRPHNDEHGRQITTQSHNSNNNNRDIYSSSINNYYDNDDAHVKCTVASASIQKYCWDPFDLQNYSRRQWYSKADRCQKKKPTASTVTYGPLTTPAATSSSTTTRIMTIIPTTTDTVKPRKSSRKQKPHVIQARDRKSVV